MLHEDNVIGVAQIGSLEAFEFSDEDQLLFRTVVSRATSGVIKAQILSDLQRAVAAREQVLAVVSHDLRNQLANIAGPAELLARKIDQLDSAGIQKFAQRIRPAVATMQSLLDDLLDMAAIQSGQVSINPQPVAVTTLLEEAFETHEAAARAKGLALTWDPIDAGVRVHADRKRILQVLDNLIGNAIKFTAPSGAVSLRAEPERTLVIISVSDTGIGIPQEELTSIFEPYRVIAPRAGTGTGLGLSIAQGIVSRHGGRIWATSEPPNGSRFSFTLTRAD
jgi:signal transduction histidine kinase